MSPAPGELTRTPRRAWVVLAVAAGLLGAANALGVVALLFNRRWMESLLGLLGVLPAYWLAMGAWRRTPWGLASVENAPPGPPALSPSSARLYAVIAAACVGALVIALGLQAVVLSR